MVQGTLGVAVQGGYMPQQDSVLKCTVVGLMAPAKPDNKGPPVPWCVLGENCLSDLYGKSTNTG